MKCEVHSSDQRTIAFVEGIVVTQKKGELTFRVEGAIEAAIVLNSPPLAIEQDVSAVIKDTTSVKMVTTAIFAILNHNIENLRE